MHRTGWKRCCDEDSSSQRPVDPIAAYSEYLPPIRFGRLPYGTADWSPVSADNSWGWRIREAEEFQELIPGLHTLAEQILSALIGLSQGSSRHGISCAKLSDNPYWPQELANAAGRLSHEKHLILLLLALSRTQDDKGRRRWTLFGNSEQGPSRAFWRGFFTGPGHEASIGKGLDFLRRLLAEVYQVAVKTSQDMLSIGFRILPREDEPLGELPTWTQPFLIENRDTEPSPRFLLTFRPFSTLAPGIRHRYLQGQLHLLPFPGSLLFWGVGSYARLQLSLPLASQIPLLQLFMRHEGPRGIRVPQSGWLHEPRPGRTFPVDHHGPLRPTFRRTHRNARVSRDVDELVVSSREDHMAHVLFSTEPDDIGLYGKPMARNVQLWTHDEQCLLDGPRATPAQIHAAQEALKQGGLFGYRFLYPAMRLCGYEIYWHRPLIAFRPHQDAPATLLSEPPLGYLTAYDPISPDPTHAIELWPHLLKREGYVLSQEVLGAPSAKTPSRTLVSVGMLLDAKEAWGESPLPWDFARRLIKAPRQETLEAWFERLANAPANPGQASRLAEVLQSQLGPPISKESEHNVEPLTFHRTAKRTFEVAYWKTIATLSEGTYLNKNNADCILDRETQRALIHHQRDLGPLGDYLLMRHERAIAAEKLEGKAYAGALSFRWQTDCSFPWMGGWLDNQQGGPQERDLVVVIPGRDRHRAIIMADHYDTAYRADRYEQPQGGHGPRIAAAGADDNGSATAALLLAAPIFLEMSAAGRLACDIWLVHLTGEEFPADCLGARHLCDGLIRRGLQLELRDGSSCDLSSTRVDGVFVLDMVAHNSKSDSDVFQMAPGRGRESLKLAYQGHLATSLWNRAVPTWNRRNSRRRRSRGARSNDPAQIPAIALHPVLSGEIRLADDPRSTLYNTDGQIFSDAGVPVVLFMENYDINRAGYHDSLDTMVNIDLDYGAAVVAIAIETVARAATFPSERF